MRKFLLTALVLLASGIVFTVSAGNNERPYYKQFAAPTIIHGMTVQGEVEYYQNDTVAFARLAKDDSLFGQKFLSGTGIHFKEDGKIDWCFLPQDCEIQGHKFKGGGHEWITCFYPNGKLESGGLAEKQTIDGIPCAEGTFWNELFGGGRTYFYEDGNLRFAKVAETVTYRGVSIKKGKHVKLKPDGTVDIIK